MVLYITYQDAIVMAPKESIPWSNKGAAALTLSSGGICRTPRILSERDSVALLELLVQIAIQKTKKTLYCKTVG